LRHPADHSFSGLRVVPLGIRAKRFQPDHSARKHFAARLLGAHRIRLWKVFDSAQGAVQRFESDRRFAYDFRCHGSTFIGADKLEKAKA